jgi:ABC transporter DrrB family efflux protein
MTARLAAPALDPRPANRARDLLLDSLALARRNLEHVRQIPEKLLDVTLQPVMFVLLFAYVFGGVIHVPGGSYREYIIAGVLIQTLAFGIMGPATSIATDLNEGIVDRFRSLPMARSAYLIGHLIAEMASITLGIVVLCLSGLVVGWRIHTDLPHALAGFALLLLFAFAMLLIGTLLGILVRSPDSAQGVVFVIVFPLTFLASTFVPLDGLPTVLREFASYNPISAVAGATRTLFGNPVATPAHPSWPLEHPVLSGFVWCFALIAVAAPLMLVRYRSRTKG